MTLARTRTFHRFPLSEKGWVQAWSTLVTEFPQLAARVRDRFIAEQTRPQAELDARAELASLGLLCSLLRCVWLGGYGFSDQVSPGSNCDLLFTNEGLWATRSRSSVPLIRSSYKDVIAIEFSGPERVTKGGGFIGEGFGVTGAPEGMIVASVLNALTTKTSIQSIIRWKAYSLELFFFTSEATAGDLRIKMSPVLGPVKPFVETPPPPTPEADALSQLERLASLHQQGIVDDEEFAELKRKIISGS